MKKIKVIIEVQETIYKWIIDNPQVFTHRLEKAVRKGTKLPEKHGRLIDLDELFKTLNSEKIPVIEDINYILRHAPVIIEAADQEEKKHDRRTNDT